MTFEKQSKQLLVATSCHLKLLSQPCLESVIWLLPAWQPASPVSIMRFHSFRMVGWNSPEGLSLLDDLIFGHV